MTRGHLVDPKARAQAMRIEGALRFVQGRGGDTPTLLFGAAIAMRKLDHRLANEAMMEAVEATMWAGHLTSGTTLVDVAKAVHTWSEPGQTKTTAGLLLLGYAERLTTGYPAPVQWWRGAVEAGADDAVGSTRLQLLAMLWNATGDMLDFESHIAIARERVRQPREDGALATLPVALACLAWSELLAGHTEAAEAMTAEGSSIASATGAPDFPGAHGIIRLGILAWRGQDAQVRQLADQIVSEAVQQGQGMTLTIVDYILSMLELAQGHYEQARRHTLAVYEVDPLYVGSLSLANLVEAACRSDDPDSAKLAIERLSERADASRTPWAVGLLARCRALMATDDEAEAHYLEALEQLGRSAVLTDLARAHLLYAEWLRRQRRRIEAREQLRKAHDIFVETGATAFATRAEAELVATGEHARQRVDHARNELTPQELQVAQLASEGGSNSEIASQLYISRAHRLVPLAQGLCQARGEYRVASYRKPWPPRAQLEPESDLSPGPAPQPQGAPARRPRRRILPLRSPRRRNQWQTRRHRQLVPRPAAQTSGRGRRASRLPGHGRPLDGRSTSSATCRTTPRIFRFVSLGADAQCVASGLGRLLGLADVRFELDLALFPGGGGALLDLLGPGREVFELI